MRHLAISLALAAALTAPAPVVAQTSTQFDAAALTSQCTAAPDGCDAYVETLISSIRASGMSVADIDRQLVLMAIILLDIAKSHPQFTVLSQALLRISAAVSNPETATIIRNLAAVVTSGNAGSIDVSDALGASPA